MILSQKKIQLPIFVQVHLLRKTGRDYLLNHKLVVKVVFSYETMSKLIIHVVRYILEKQ